jgi:hypothetical protein
LRVFVFMEVTDSAMDFVTIYEAADY